MSRHQCIQLKIRNNNRLLLQQRTEITKGSNYHMLTWPSTSSWHGSTIYCNWQHHIIQFSQNIATKNNHLHINELCTTLLYSVIHLITTRSTRDQLYNAGLQFLSDAEKCISQISSYDHCQSEFQFQCRLVLIQRFNALTIQGTFVHTPTTGWILAFFSDFWYLFLTLKVYTTEGK